MPKHCDIQNKIWLTIKDTKGENFLARATSGGSGSPGAFQLTHVPPEEPTTPMVTIPVAQLEAKEESLDTKPFMSPASLHEDRELSQTLFSKKTIEYLNEFPSLIVLKEKAMYLHTYYISSLDERFKQKPVKEFIRISERLLIPLYIIKISNVSLSGLYEYIRKANQNPPQYWICHPNNKKFQLLAIPMTRVIKAKVLEIAIQTL